MTYQVKYTTYKTMEHYDTVYCSEQELPDTIREIIEADPDNHIITVKRET